MATNGPTEQTPLTHSIEEGHAEQQVSRPSPRSTSPTDATFSKNHLQTFTKPTASQHTSSPLDPSKLSIIPPTIPSLTRPSTLLSSSKPPKSTDILSISRTKQNKNRARKNLAAFRRKRQDYATWKGRVGVHVETDEIDLKNLINVIYSTLGTEWELVDHYDVIRLWLPTDNTHFSGEENAPSGGNEYSGDGEIHASMPEVFVFGFGAVVFWNFGGEHTEREWMERHLLGRENLIGLRHSGESVESACDEMAFCYGEEFRWHRDVVQLQTRDAGEKLAVSFAVAKSANLSIYEWRLEQAVQRNSHIPEDLAKSGELHLNRREINVEIGKLYLLNNAINLETNMLDTPEEFWEDDRFQPEYERTLKYFDVDSRISILNSRLNVLKNLNQILMDAAHNAHASVLEWIIIVLIIAEIAIDLWRAWRDYSLC